MREVIADIDRWRLHQEPVALATVVETWGSAPRGVGAKMALTASGQIAGSVSGGCVEGAVFDAGVETLETGRAQLLSFGVADETAWDVGLACGGQIQVFVEPLVEQVYQPIHQWLHEEESGVVATIIAGASDQIGKKLIMTKNSVLVDELPPGLHDTAMRSVRDTLKNGAPQTLNITTELEATQLFVEPILPAPTLVMVGGVHIAVALSAIAKAVGYRTIVVDPRRAFSSEERFPNADRLIQAWPDEAMREVKLNEATAVAMLTHDPKIDDPALKVVLPSAAFYVGALGSRSTHEKRRKRLLEAGVAEELVNRIHSPIGLDIEAQTPEEIAVAVMAEIIATRHKGTNAS